MVIRAPSAYRLDSVERFSAWENSTFPPANGAITPRPSAGGPSQKTRSPTAERSTAAASALKSSSPVIISTVVTPDSSARSAVTAASSSLGARCKVAARIRSRCSSSPAHISTSSPASCRARPRSMTQSSPPTSSGRLAGERSTPRIRAAGTAAAE